MNVNKVTATVRYSQDSGKGAWKSLELGAEASINEKEDWMKAQVALYGQLAQQFKALWSANNGRTPAEGHQEAAVVPVQASTNGNHALHCLKNTLRVPRNIGVKSMESSLKVGSIKRAGGSSIPIARGRDGTMNDKENGGKEIEMETNRQRLAFHIIDSERELMRRGKSDEGEIEICGMHFAQMSEYRGFAEGTILVITIVSEADCRTCQDDDEEKEIRVGFI
jgi:hypothetical protein